MITKISGGKVILEDRIAEQVNIYCENGVIRDVTAAPEPYHTEIDARGCYIAPGFVDIHTHGAGGADFMDGTPEAFLTAASAHVHHGTTTVIPTAASPSPGETLRLSRALEEARQVNLLGADLPGLHLEGPYLAAEARGTMDERRLRLPKPAEYLPLLNSCGRILRWSIAPELPGAPELGRELQRRGIVAAIAHTCADHARMEAAVEAGYTHMTHLYEHCTHPGAAEAALSLDGLTAELVSDITRLPPELFGAAYKRKGPDKMALITDSGRTTCMPGGSAAMDKAVRMMVKTMGVPLTDVVRMASRTPSRIMGLNDRGSIRPGLRADLVLFDEEINVTRVMVGGRTVSEAEQHAGKQGGTSHVD